MALHFCVCFLYLQLNSQLAITPVITTRFQELKGCFDLDTALSK